MTIGYVGVGSNLGSRETNIERAKQLLETAGRIRWVRSAPVYETDPVGGPPQGRFLNTVWEIETDLKPAELLSELHQIESRLGRARKVKNEPRGIDLDILFFGEMVLTGSLEVPHPRSHERWFVLKPLADLAPELVHPVLKKTVRELLKEIEAAK